MTSYDSGQTFGWPVRVYIEDTDAGGIVFHARYLHYMERARTEWVRSRGISLRAGMSDNISYVVQRLSIHYAAPGKLDDELTVTAEPVAFGRVWMEFNQQVTRDRDCKLLCEATVRVACIALDSGRPMRLPDEMRGMLEQSSETKHQINQE